jgi:hypothetical protein
MISKQKRDWISSPFFVYQLYNDYTLRRGVQFVERLHQAALAA